MLIIMSDSESGGTLYLVGLGLYGKEDMTVEGLKVLRNVDKVFGEFYTSFLGIETDISDIEDLIGQDINILNRDQVENGFNDILKKFKEKNIGFVTAGDPMVATTHSDIRLKALKLGMDTNVVHAPSVFSAIAETGLQIYKFGRSTSIVFPQEDRNYFPTSYYDVIKENMENGHHTMLFLDIESDENRYMTVSDAVDILLKAEDKRGDGILDLDTIGVGVARIGSDDPVIRADYLKNLRDMNLGDPLHTLVLPGELHHVESKYLVKMANGPDELLDD